MRKTNENKRSFPFREFGTLGKGDVPIKDGHFRGCIIGGAKYGQVVIGKQVALYEIFAKYGWRNVFT